MFNLPDYRLEPPEPKIRTWCRNCGAEGVDKYYFDERGEFIGCEQCITERDAWYYEEEE